MSGLRKWSLYSKRLSALLKAHKQLSAGAKAALTSNYQQDRKLHSQAIISRKESCTHKQLSAGPKAALTSNYQQERKLHSQAIISRTESCTHKQLSAGPKAALTSNYQQDRKLHSQAIISRTESCTHKKVLYHYNDSVVDLTKPGHLSCNFTRLWEAPSPNLTCMQVSI